VILHHTVVVFRWIIVLNQVVPDVPFPDDGARCRSCRFDFDNAVGPELIIVKQARVAARGDALGVTFHLPGDHQDITGGEHLYIMMLAVLAA